MCFSDLCGGITLHICVLGMLKAIRSLITHTEDIYSVARYLDILWIFWREMCTMIMINSISASYRRPYVLQNNFFVVIH